MKRLLRMQDVPFPGKQRAFGPAVLCGVRGVRSFPEKPTASPGADRGSVYIDAEALFSGARRASA